MENLQIFNSEEFGEIRTVMKDGEPLFCLSDVCRVLEIKNVSDCKSRLLSKGVVITDTLTNGGNQKMTFINEANLYKVIFQSRKPSAERFTDWVTEDVLPQIRKTGSYSKPMSTAEQIKLLAQGNTELNERVDRVEEDVSSLKNDTPLYGCEIEEVSKHIKRKAVEVLGGYRSEAYNDHSIRGKVFSDIYNQIKREYGCVSSYKSIKRKYIDEVHGFIDRYTPPTALGENIRDCNSQIRMCGHETGTM